MPHRSPITFHEFSKEMFEERDAPGRVAYPNDIKRDTMRLLAQVDSVRRRLTEIQRECSHAREVVNLAPARKNSFQCLDCGVIRFRPFGVIE